MKKALLSIATVIMVGGCSEVPNDMSHIDVFLPIATYQLHINLISLLMIRLSILIQKYRFF